MRYVQRKLWPYSRERERVKAHSKIKSRNFRGNISLLTATVLILSVFLLFTGAALAITLPTVTTSSISPILLQNSTTSVTMNGLIADSGGANI